MNDFISNFTTTSLGVLLFAVTSLKITKMSKMSIISAVFNLILPFKNPLKPAEKPYIFTVFI
ncbi:MAG: hypothetical protein DWP97_06990 [Calditrichaeota bacterium]|nr:MAG: hypothetical protein DWP97_06990 [Calditrichota bacterium]